MVTHPARIILACASTVLALTLLGGCASGLSKDECQTADWGTIGYEDGLRGHASDRIGVHRVACAKHQVAPNLAAYAEGRERGLLEYCQPRNGFRAGLNGHAYANVCPRLSEPTFVDAYRQGREIHDARSDLRRTQSRLQSAKNGVVDTDAALQIATAELLQPRLPTDRRLFLATELVRLADQRAEHGAQIQRLTSRARELAGVVRDLERRSPYVL
jgi:hypothetical protein